MTKKQVEYFDDTHQYLVDGVEVPSVSRLVSYVLKTEISNIPKDVLEKASAYGTRVHEIVEYFFDEEKVNINMNEDEEEIFDKWFDLSLEKKISLINSEQIVFTDDFAGRYDLLAEVDGVKTLIDIKTNRIYPKRHLELQMGLYLYALGEDIPCACVWWDKTNREWSYKEVIPVDKKYVEELVHAFKNDLEPPTEPNDLEGIELYTPTELEKLEHFYVLKEDVEEIENNRKEKMKIFMRENNFKTLENDMFKITYTGPTTRKDVDTDKLKAEGLYENYSKTVNVKDKITITHKWLKAKEQKS